MRLKAAVFDMDGVVTRTATLHLAAWTQVFDPLLRRRAERSGEPLRRFTVADYRAHVDGRPRHDGIRTFLAARGIALPAGSASDPPGADTVAGLARRKNEAFHRLLEERGVDVYESTVRLVRELRGRGVAVAVASSSRNCRAVLERAELAELFEARVDGVVSDRLGLRGKPAPDIFLEAVERLGADGADAAMVVEDASAGVEAGRAGGFALVLGVDRSGDGVVAVSERAGGSKAAPTSEAEAAGAASAVPGAGWLALREHGADWIVRDLGAVTPEALDRWIEHRSDARPNALFAWSDLERRIAAHRPVVVLDADGSLAAAAEGGPCPALPAEHLGPLLEEKEPDVLPVRFGDGPDDEEAFRALSARGLGVLVAELPRRTAAHYSLQDAGEMRLALRRLARLDDSSSARGRRMSRRKREGPWPS